MFRILFDIIINLLGTVVQLVVLPLNLAITAVLPDFSNQLIAVNTAIADIVQSLVWPLSILPGSLVAILIFILTCEIAKHTIYISTHTLIKVWTIIQKVKFW